MVLRLLIIAFLLATTAGRHVGTQALSWPERLSHARHGKAVHTSLRRTRNERLVTAPDPEQYYVEEAIVRALDRLRIKEVAKRVLERAPSWIARLNTRDIRMRQKLVDERGLTKKYAAAVRLLRARNVDVGDYLEFGVYNGSSLLCMHRVLEKAGVGARLIGFDSFEGLPDVATTDSGGHWQPGAFKSSLDFTRRVLDYEGVDWNRVTLVKGFFDETLTDERRDHLGIARAGLIMIDCDLYQSTKEALAFCTPAIVDQSVIFFDDWYPLAHDGLGERQAFEEWLSADRTLSAEELFEFKPYGKAFVVTRTATAV